jgi:hypothetical protein
LNNRQTGYITKLYLKKKEPWFEVWIGRTRVFLFHLCGDMADRQPSQGSLAKFGYRAGKAVNFFFGEPCYCLTTCTSTHFKSGELNPKTLLFWRLVFSIENVLLLGDERTPELRW